MKLRIFLVSAIVFSAACSGPKQPVAQDASAVAQDASAKAELSQSCPETPPFYSPLPDTSLKFNFPFHLKSDRIYAAGNGEARRGIVLEFLDGDSEQTWSSLDASLIAAGYAPAAEIKVDQAGKKQRPYSKNGAPGLSIAVSSDPSTNPANPDAKGVIWISWRLTPPAANGATSPPMPSDESNEAGAAAVQG